MCCMHSVGKLVCVRRFTPNWSDAFFSFPRHVEPNKYISLHSDIPFAVGNAQIAAKHGVEI